jgi:RimJ/RimL family protein N-acetyltransferase
MSFSSTERTWYGHNASFARSIRDGMVASQCAGATLVGEVSPLGHLGASMTPRMFSIETELLTLEPQTVAHAAEMFMVLNDPAIYAYENEPPSSLEWLRERFAKLETRVSANGSQQWLNWVIRLPTSELIGYVQATIFEEGRAAIAYELSSAYWGRGLGRHAVGAMISELVRRYGVRRLSAILVRENIRSRRLLERLDFSLASPDEHATHGIAAGEILMQRELASQ